MHRKTAVLVVGVLALAGLMASTAGAAVDQAKLDEAFKELPSYDWGQSRSALNVIDDAIVQTHGDADARKAIEKRLAGLLGGKATRAAKQYVCRKLAVIGSCASVGELAPLLTDKELSHMARYALERMPCPDAGKAIREAMGKVSGQLKVGMINSIGMRRDEQAVEALIPLLKAGEAPVANAAAAALGRIGHAKAVEPLKAFLAKASKDQKTVAYDAVLDLAAGLCKGDGKDQAIAIYQMLYAKDQPSRVRRAALQGLAMAQPEKSVPLVLDALASEDVAFRGLAMNMVREMPGTEATKAFADAMGKLPPVGQVAMLNALAARGDDAARPAVLQAAKSDNEDVAKAAVEALGSVGSAEDVGFLAETAAKGGPAAGNARNSLAQLPGKAVDDKIVSAMSAADEKVKVELLGALAARVANEKVGKVQELASVDNADVRRAAIEAMASLGGIKQVPVLVAMAKKPTDGGDRGSIEKALTAICSRVRGEAAEDLVAGLKGADADAKVLLLKALGRTGGKAALKAVVEATKSDDKKVQDAAIRVLSSWADEAAIDPLLEIASSTDNKVHKVLALRGVVNLARQRGTKQDVRWNALSKAMPLAPGDGEKRMILGALRDVRTIEALRLVAKYVDQPKLADEAGSAATRIADRVWKKDKELTRQTMLKVLDHAKNKRTKDDAKKILGRVAPK